MKIFGSNKKTFKQQGVMTPKSIEMWITSQIIRVFTRKIMANYDFTIGIANQFEESLAVMVLLWDLNPYFLDMLVVVI